MTVYPETEIRNRVAVAIRTGDILHVPYESKLIAALYNADVTNIAMELTEAGLRAGINMELGIPHRDGQPGDPIGERPHDL